MTDAASLDEAFEGFLVRTQTQFEQFSEANEQSFSKAFLHGWQTFNQALLEMPPAVTKPPHQPNATPGDTALTSPPAPPTHHTASIPDAARNRQSAIQSSRDQSQPALGLSRLEDFYGHRLPSLPLTSLPVLKGLSPQDLLAFRQQALSQRDFRQLIDYFAFSKQRLQTDSYTGLLLARQLCQQHYLPVLQLQQRQQLQAQHNIQWVCSWVLAQSQGQDVRLGLQQQQLLLLAASEQQWYERPFFNLGQHRYYIINPDDYQVERGPTHLQVAAHADAQGFTQVTLSRGLAAAQTHMLSRQKFAVDIQLDQDHVAYLYHLPQLTISHYLNDRIPPYLVDQLASAFRPEPDTSTAIRQLLHSLQQLPYQVDEQQFGVEKPLTLSELLYFDYSDCEDRVYALAAIGGQFWQQATAGLRFPGHLSAAVKIDQRWHEADPTYLGATLGMRQPVYQKMDPEWFF